MGGKKENNDNKVIAGCGGMDNRIIAGETTGRCRGIPIKELTRRKPKKKKNE